MVDKRTRSARIEDEIRISFETLKDFITEVFVRAGMSREDSETQAKVLLWSDLRGEDSHGVRVVPGYVESIRSGHINVKPDLKIERETPATFLIDADFASGPVVTVFAMNRAMEKAKKVGIGWACIRNANHQGAIGYYSHIAAEKEMVGITFTCSRANMAPYGARAPGTSNNTFAIAVPARKHRPVVLDMSTSVAAAAKIMLARDEGVPIPLDWALDKDGNPTTDPSLADILLPVGGHKGSGLSIMLECLASVMVDNPKLEPVLKGSEEPTRLSTVTGQVRRSGRNSVVAAIDIGAFIDVERYKEHIDSLIDGLKALPRAEGFREILVPGERGWQSCDDRLRDGIPLPRKTVLMLKSVAEKLGITPPFS